MCLCRACRVECRWVEWECFGVWVQRSLRLGVGPGDDSVDGRPTSGGVVRRIVCSYGSEGEGVLYTPRATHLDVRVPVPIVEKPVLGSVPAQLGSSCAARM